MFRSAHWSDSETNAAHSSFELIGDIALTANFTPIAISDYTVATDETKEADAYTVGQDVTKFGVSTTVAQ